MVVKSRLTLTVLMLLMCTFSTITFAQKLDSKDNVELAKFEPMKNVLVKPRLEQLSTFYEE